MDSFMATELCENCKRSVPAENYQMHMAHCKRNIQICPLCGEAVSQREEKEHFEEYHAEIKCVQCGQKTTRIEEGNHLANECGKRPIPCRYCEISLPRERMTEHEEYCGSRTEWCPKCSRYVLIKDLQGHEKSCDEGSRNAVLPCEFCGVPIAYNRFDAHQRQCLIERGDVPLLVEGDDGLFREIGAATSKVANNHEETACIGSGSENFTRSVSKERSANNAEGENSIVALPCEICGELCPSDRLMEHQEECGQDSESDLNVEFSTSGSQEPDGSDFRFVRMHRDHPGAEMDSTFDPFVTMRSPHDVLGNLFQQRVFHGLEGRMWPFEMMRNLWPPTTQIRF